MKILAAAMSAVAAVWLESFFMAGIGAPETIYFSLILIIILLLAGRPRLALAAALASGLAAELAAMQTPFGFLLAAQALAYAAANKTLNGIWIIHPAAKTMLAVIVIAGYSLFRQIIPWFFILLSDNGVKPRLPLQSVLMSAIFTALFFLAALYATHVIRRLVKKWFL